MARSTTLFSIRYAVRVLERTARFWAKVAALIKACALLAGSGAIYALSVENRFVAMFFGVFFAVTQAIEFAVEPAQRSALARAARISYARLLAHQAEYGDEALESVYQTIVSDDEVIVMESLRRIAYNDVLEERGDDASHAYELSAWQRLIAFMA